MLLKKVLVESVLHKNYKLFSYFFPRPPRPSFGCFARVFVAFFLFLAFRNKGCSEMS
jgi:hypothetical protein